MCEEFEEITRKTYDVISPDWDLKRRYFWRVVVDFLSDFEEPSKLSLLDVGCGGGRFLELALKLGFSLDGLVGCDYSRGQLKVVSKKGFQTVCCRVESLEFDDCSFDVLLCIAVFHHLTSENLQRKALTEMFRVMKRGSKLLLSVWIPQEEYVNRCVKSGKFLFLDEARKVVRVFYSFDGEKYERYYYLFSREELYNLVVSCGFEVLSEKYDGGNLYFVLSK